MKTDENVAEEFVAKTKLRKEFVTKWVEALRSGEYDQINSSLYDGEGYCCLGVACVVEGIKPKLIGRNYYFEDESCFWPVSMQEKYDMHNAFDLITNDDIVLYMSFTVMNDTYGFTFDQIADILEWKYLS